MTVEELIKLLQAYPKDMLVVDDIGLLEPSDLQIIEEYPLGDGANPNCIFKDKVLIIY